MLRNENPYRTNVMSLSRNEKKKYGVIAVVVLLLAWIVWPAKEPYMTPEQAVELCGQIDTQIDDELYALGEDDSPLGPQAKLDGYGVQAKSATEGAALLEQLRGKLAESRRAEAAREQCCQSMRALSKAVYTSEDGLRGAVGKFEGEKVAVAGHSKTMADCYEYGKKAVAESASREAGRTEARQKACGEQAQLCTEAAAMIRKHLPDLESYVEACVQDGNSSEAATILQDNALSLEEWAQGYEQMKLDLDAQAGGANGSEDVLWIRDASGQPQWNAANPKAQECQEVLKQLEALSLSQPGEFPPAPSRLELPPVPPPPAPPAKPDMVIAATGDLPTSLLRPLLDGWAKGLGSDGVTEEEGMVVYRIPGAEMGADAGVFRVKIVTLEGENAFASLQDGSVDMLLTGRIVAGQTLEEWNAALEKTCPSLSGDGNVSRRMAHVAYDALIFFGGTKDYSNGLTLRDIISTRKLFCIGEHDSGRGEAAAVCGLARQEQDVVLRADEAAVSTGDLLNRSVAEGALCVGVYHSDMSWLPRLDSAYASTIEGNLKELPQKLKRRVIAVRGNKNGDVITPPTRYTISSGDYTYTYRINLFNNKGGEAACSLMEYVLTPEAQAIVEENHFVSSRVIGTQAVRLRSDVLPVKEVAAALGDAYGYGPKDQCLYGVRMPDKLSVHFDFKSSALPAFAIHQDNPKAAGETVAEFLKLTPEVAMVFVGHADCVYLGRVNYSSLSFSENKKLSGQRAVTVKNFYEAQRELEGKPVRMVTVGASWLYPRRYIDPTQSLELQQVPLADSRRVELFLIVPKAVGEKLLAGDSEK